MASFLYRLGRWSFRARKLVVLAWIAVLALAGGAAAVLSTGTDNTFRIPGTESQSALDALDRTFPQVSGSSARLVVIAPDGASVESDPVRDAISTAIDDIEAVDEVAAVSDPFDDAIEGVISDDGDAAVITIQLDIGTSSVTSELRSDLLAAADALRAQLPDHEVHLGGEAFSQNLPTVTITEAIGVLIALVVLIVTFGSFLAAGMPLLTALLGVGISMSGIFAATAFGTVSSTTPLLALMLGLAVGIDYALFIISRHLDQVRAGMPPEESAARAVGTAGSAVIFAGLTVVIALVGLSVANIPFLTVMGVAAACAVAVAVAIAVTLTPALLGFARDRVPSRRTARAAAAAAAESPEPPAAAVRRGWERGAFFARWVAIVTRRPVLTIVLVVAALGTASIPAAQLQLALPDAGGQAEGTPGRDTYDALAEQFGPGYNGPLIVTGTIVESSDPLGLMADLKREIEQLDGVASVPLATPNETADTGILQVIPEGAPDSQQTKDLVSELRALQPYFAEEYDFDLAVTGYTAVGIDISDRLAGALLPFGLLVVGLSLVLLTAVFRSLWVPVKAAAGYLLSVGASFGVVVAVFQWGWGADLIHVASLGPVISFMPIILMGVLFGLAMDYEVFLVSRMREEYVHGKDARSAIREGFLGSGRVVTAAALIMFAVFAAFVPEGDVNIKPIALGLAVGVFVDAFIVRMTLVPAVLQLLGDRAWRMPRALDRVIPSFDVEGEGLARELALEGWPVDGERIAVAARGLSTSGVRGAPVDVVVPSGGALVVAGAPRSGRSALLLALTGRLTDVRGDLRVLGLLLPERAAAVRSRASIVQLAVEPRRADAIDSALRERPRLLAIDDLDAIVDHGERARVRAALADAVRVDPDLVIVATASNVDRVADLLPPTTPAPIALHLSGDAATPADQPLLHHSGALS